MIKFLGLTFLLINFGCGYEQGNSSSVSSTRFSNAPSSLSEDSARVFNEPIFDLLDEEDVEVDFDFSRVLPATEEFITRDSILEGACPSNNENFKKDCFIVLENEDNESPITQNDSTWGYEIGTTDFNQVNLYYHSQKLIDSFFEVLIDAHEKADPNSGENDYLTSLPKDLLDEGFGWGSDELEVYSDCEGLTDNAYFIPSNFHICFFPVGANQNISVGWDESVVYHELGHAIQHVMLNMRNKVAGLDETVEFGYLDYDDTGSIGEGISDFFTYFMTKKSRIGRFSLGNPNFGISASRPLTESDDLHVSGISDDWDQRLRYPEYTHYDPNYPNLYIDDIHMTGMIISHYLIALEQDMIDQCGIDVDDEDEEDLALKYIMRALIETYSEIGDLTATGTDELSDNETSVNLDADHSLEWFRTAKPVTIRSFIQKFSKYIYQIYSKEENCNGTSYSKTRIEYVLDAYGLLLFSTFNEDGDGYTNNDSSTPLGHDGDHTAITEYNRIHTSFVSKDNLGVVDEVGEVEAFIIDARDNIDNIINGALSIGRAYEISDEIPSDFKWNNGNGYISPGEIVGVVMNLYNDSNAPMTSVQVLANDWDHVKDGEPCNNFEDNFPLDTEGAADSDDAAGTLGNCNYVTRSNGSLEPTQEDDDDPSDEVYPVCLVQIGQENETIWATQDKLMEEMNLDESKCLYGDNTKNCFINVIKGIDQATYSIIPPQSTWSETFLSDENTSYDRGHAFYMEVNPYISAGTTFRCRLRARFTNCKDCFENEEEDNDDYLDYEYSGPKPFKIIHFEFTVVD